MKLCKAFFGIFLCLYLFQSNAQDTDYIEKQTVISSKILMEDRAVKLYYPDSISKPLLAVYLLDGNWNYELVKGLLSHWNRWDLASDFILVSIDNNESRTRDMTPTPDEVKYPGSGGAYSFLNFIESELKTTINVEFPAIEKSMLIGHSFGGLFGLFTLKERPDLFDAYISISPSIWWKDEYMYSEYNFEELESKPFVYVCSGENDKLNATELSKYTTWIDTTGHIDQLEFHQSIFKNEDHFSVVPIAIHQGLSLYFDNDTWAFNLVNIYEKEGIGALQAKSAELKSSFGLRFDLPAGPFLSVALKLYKSEAISQSIDLLEWISQEKPSIYEPYYYLGAFMTSIDEMKAKEYYAQALKMENIPDRMKIVIERKIKELKL